ncbi:MAG: relaxase/mobilization nuclease domain-containing protein [Alphaproteobacteria bacterium]|nr:relaxase/mobilization nuclease domain-containing protein [Alphaproteobacteria bacterium]
MIGKVPQPGRGFRGLVHYLLNGPRRTEEAQHRVAWTATRNLFTDDPAKAPTLMRMTAAKSVRVRSPVYHLVISWHEGECPPPALMRQVADATCRDIGLEEHQRVYVAHHDTRHPHVHIVANRIHPETGRAWQTSHDYRRIEQSLARQARELGLAVVPGRHNGKTLDRTLPRRPRDSERQRANRTSAQVRGRWPPERIAELRPLLRPLFHTANSWEELEAGLASDGLRLVAKGQGLVIADDTGEMKLSDLGAGIRQAGLEARFGGWHRQITSNLVIHPSQRRRARSMDR